MSDHRTDDHDAGDEPLDPPTRSNTPGSPSDASAAAEDLRATGDSIRADARRLVALEDDKFAMDADDPAVDRLSDDAVELAKRIVRETTAERQLSQEIG